jgi:hypothetical protein
MPKKTAQKSPSITPDTRISKPVFQVPAAGLLTFLSKRAESKHTQKKTRSSPDITSSHLKLPDQQVFAPVNSCETFANDTFLPLSAIHNIIVNGVNACSPNGAPGGNESPELSWSGVPLGTRSFVVITLRCDSGVHALGHVQHSGGHQKAA